MELVNQVNKQRGKTLGRLQEGHFKCNASSSNGRDRQKLYLTTSVQRKQEQGINTWQSNSEKRALPGIGKEIENGQQLTSDSHLHMRALSRSPLYGKKTREL